MRKTSLTEKIINFLKFPSRASLAKRLNRMQFIKAQVITFMMYAAFFLLIAEILPHNPTDGLRLVLILPFLGLFLFFYLCTIANRLHDFDCSGWWALIFFIPYLNVLFLLGLCTRPGSKGENQHGEPSQIWVFANAREN